MVWSTSKVASITLLLPNVNSVAPPISRLAVGCGLAICKLLIFIASFPKGILTIFGVLIVSVAKLQPSFLVRLKFKSISFVNASEIILPLCFFITAVPLALYSEPNVIFSVLKTGSKAPGKLTLTPPFGIVGTNEGSPVVGIKISPGNGLSNKSNSLIAENFQILSFPWLNFNFCKLMPNWGIRENSLFIGLVAVNKFPS